MHSVQRFILSQLAESPALRYSDMRPKSMEASQFMYHLKALIQKGYAQKNTAGLYALTAKGKRYIDGAGDDLLPRELPRVAGLVVCRGGDRGVLYWRRTTHPAYGQLGFPVIDISFDEERSLDAFISKEFTARSGLQTQLKHRGDGYINLYDGEMLVGSLFAHLYEGEVDDSQSLHGADADLIWENEVPADSQFIISTNHLLDALQGATDHFFFELHLEEQNS